MRFEWSHHRIKSILALGVTALLIRDCAIIIRRGGPKTRGGEALHKIAAKTGGAQSKIAHLREGGP